MKISQYNISVRDILLTKLPYFHRIKRFITESPHFHRNIQVKIDLMEC